MNSWGAAALSRANSAIAVVSVLAVCTHAEALERTTHSGVGNSAAHETPLPKLFGAAVPSAQT